MAKRRSAAQIARDRRRIADMYLAGAIQQDIADELELSQTTISDDLKALQKEWRESSLIDLDKAKATELARIDRLEREYWHEWEESKQNKETITKKGTEGKSGERKEATIKEEGQRGDPRYLSGVQWCIEQRCKIVGIYAAEKRELTGKDGGAIEHHVGPSIFLPQTEDKDAGNSAETD